MMLTIRQFPVNERPRERCLKSGPRCLSLRECLALILNTGPRGQGSLGLALRLLESLGDRRDSPWSEGETERAFFHALESSGHALPAGLPGLGPAARARLLAAFELGRRYSHFRERALARAEDPRPVRREELSQRALERIPAELRTEPREWLGFVAQPSPGVLSEFCLVERGARTHVNVEPAELFARILALRPRGFFLFHNHPSGSLRASEADRELTTQVEQTSNQLGITLLGHWIVTPRGEIRI